MQKVLEVYFYLSGFVIKVAPMGSYYFLEKKATRLHNKILPPVVIIEPKDNEDRNKTIANTKANISVAKVPSAAPIES